MCVRVARLVSLVILGVSAPILIDVGHGFTDGGGGETPAPVNAYTIAVTFGLLSSALAIYMSFSSNRKSVTRAQVAVLFTSGFCHATAYTMLILYCPWCGDTNDTLTRASSSSSSYLTIPTITCAQAVLLYSAVLNVLFFAMLLRIIHATTTSADEKSHSVV